MSLASQPVAASIGPMVQKRRAPKLRLFVADDHPLILNGIKSLFQVRDATAEVAGFAAVAALEIALNEEPSPDLVLIDFDMPGLASVEAFAGFIGRHLDVPIAVMSGHSTSQRAQELIQCGCRGFVPKSAVPSAVYYAIRLMIGGGRFIPELLADSGWPNVPADRADIAQAAAPGRHRLGLTRREIDVLHALADGSTNKQIARNLNIEEVTVKLHLRRAYAKLRVRNRIEAVLAILQGALDG